MKISGLESIVNNFNKVKRITRRTIRDIAAAAALSLPHFGIIGCSQESPTSPPIIDTPPLPEYAEFQSGTTDNNGKVTFIEGSTRKPFTFVANPGSVVYFADYSDHEVMLIDPPGKPLSIVGFFDLESLNKLRGISDEINIRSNEIYIEPEDVLANSANTALQIFGGQSAKIAGLSNYLRNLNKRISTTCIQNSPFELTYVDTQTLEDILTQARTGSQIAIKLISSLTDGNQTLNAISTALNNYDIEDLRAFMGNEPLQKKFVIYNVPIFPEIEGVQIPRNPLMDIIAPANIPEISVNSYSVIDNTVSVDLRISRHMWHYNRLLKDQSTCVRNPGKVDIDLKTRTNFEGDPNPIHGTELVATLSRNYDPEQNYFTVPSFTIPLRPNNQPITPGDLEFTIFATDESGTTNATQPQRFTIDNPVQEQTLAITGGPYILPVNQIIGSESYGELFWVASGELNNDISVTVYNTDKPPYIAINNPPYSVPKRFWSDIPQDFATTFDILKALTDRDIITLDSYVHTIVSHHIPITGYSEQAYTYSGNPTSPFRAWASGDNIHLSGNSLSATLDTDETKYEGNGGFVEASVAFNRNILYIKTNGIRTADSDNSQRYAFIYGYDLSNNLNKSEFYVVGNPIGFVGSSPNNTITAMSYFSNPDRLVFTTPVGKAYECQLP